MVDGKSVKEDIAEEKERLGKMTWEQKKEHIWEYYKIPIISIIVLIAAIIGIIYMYKLNDYENVFYTVVIDGSMEGMSAKEDALTKEFTEYLGIDGKDERVYFDNNYTLTYINSIDQDPYISAEKIMTQIATGSIDGIIAEKAQINGFSKDDQSAYMDLSLCLTEEEFKAIEDHIIYYTLKDGTKVPNAVDLSDTRIVTQMGLTVKEPCFGIIISAPHTENGVEFIRYAFDLK
ncbi:MAG: hypothetical protein PUE71_06360 [Clostridia bacterium]|nr:hypothetical protein [Clostridia bacterium]